MKFRRLIEKIIETIDMNNCVQQCSTQLTPTQLAHVFLNLCLPSMIFKNAIIPSLEHGSLFCRHQGIGLLTVMLKKTKLFLKLTTDASKYAILKKIILDYISKNTQDFEIIFKVWNKAFLPDEEELLNDVIIPLKKEHFASIMELLLMYCDIYPELSLVEGNSNLDPMEFFTGLDTLLEVDKNEIADLKIKAVQFLLSLDDNIFDATKDIFEKALILLMSELNRDSLTRDILVALLTQVFKGFNDEIDIWIEVFTSLESVDEKITVAHWFAKTIKQAVQRNEEYISLVAETEELGDDQILGSRKLNIFQDLMEDRAANSTKEELLITKLLPLSSISTVACCAAKRVKKKSKLIILQYLSRVFVDILHCQISPRALIYLIQDIEDLQTHKYLTSWLDESPLSFDSNTLLCPVTKFLFTETEININEVISSLSKYQTINYLRTTLFCLTQFAQRGILTQEFNDKCKIVILRLLVDGSCIEECFNWIFRHPVLLEYFKPLRKKKQKIEEIITKTLCEIYVQFNSFPDSKLIAPFQAKLVAQLKSALEKKSKIKQPKDLVDVLSAFNPNPNDSLDLLRNILKLPKNSLMLENEENSPSLSAWGIIEPNLLNICFRDKALHKILKEEHFVRKMLAAFIELKTRKINDLTNWEHKLLKYFNTFPGDIKNIEKETFMLLFKHDISSVMVKILSLFVQQSEAFASIFVNIVLTDKNILKQKDVIFPIMSNSLSYTWNNKFLTKVYSTYKERISKYLIQPVKNVYWIKENVKAVIYLIKKSFKPAVCTKICETILQNGDKITVINIEYIQLLEALFSRNDNNVCSLLHFVHVLVHVMVSTLKKEANDTEKLEFLGETLCKSITSLKAKSDDFVFEDLSKSHAWPQFTRFSLKLGFKSKSKTINRLLNVLSKTCDIAYKDNSANEYVKTMFEMTTSHSEFISIMLGSSVTKRDLLELLWTFVRKNNSVMLSNHVPLYLAAYKATLSEADQFILMILQYYENNKIDLHEYQPYLYGEAAATHFSVRDQSGTALWRQPSTSQVFDLFLPELVSDTITNFPVDRKLQCENLHEVAEVYDPAFYLPLLCSLLSENNLIAYYKVVQSGALALVVIACTSKCKRTRLAAYTAISQFYFHLNSSRFSTNDRWLWIRFIEALKNGIMSLEIPLLHIRLNGFVSTFLARASLIISEPLNPLYASLHAFLMAKPALDLNKIPEFLNFLHSSTVEHMSHRHWILQVIRDGLKTDNDVHIALRCFVFKMLFSFYRCCLADRETKHLILEVVESASKIPMAGQLLVNGYALLPWLNESAVTLDPRDRHSIDLIVNIALNLSHALSITKSRNSHLLISEPRYHNMLLSVLLSLKPHLATDLTVAIFTRYVNVMQEVLVNGGQYAALTIEHTTDIFEFAKKLSIVDVDDYEDVLQCGCKFITPGHDDNDEVTIARKSFLKLLQTWSK